MITLTSATGGAWAAGLSLPQAASVIAQASQSAPRQWKAVFTDPSPAMVMHAMAVRTRRGLESFRRARPAAAFASSPAG
ncbi:exported hypothetical protein [Cupriavidus necator]|uniref:Uncharacterized protein n=1 Tax=Cupriavidus necator TaxID=106590 RepID=A0A1K0I9A4_CUPNE|nr:exported hypothetical protein [Cupriavidus necator]